MLGRTVIRRQIYSLVGLALVLSAISTADAGDWRITPRAQSETVYTDNVRGVADGKEGDVFHSGSSGVSIRGRGARLNLNLDYTLSYEEYLAESELSSRTHRLLGSANTELIREHLFVDAQTSFNRVIDDRTGAISNVDRNLGDNQTEVFNFRVSPRYVFNFGNFARSTTRYTFSQISFDPLNDDSDDNDPPSDTTTNRVSQTIASGADFTQLSWALSANYRRSSRSESDNNFTTRSGEARAEYAINRMISVLGSAGYEDLDDNSVTDDDELFGEIWTVGARVRPGPRTDLSFEYGRRYDDDFYRGSGSFEITPTLRANLSYDITVDIEQSAADNAFLFIGQDEEGNFIDIRTGLPIDVVDSDFDLTDQDTVLRNETFSASLSGTRGRNRYGLRLAHTQRTTEPEGREQNVLSGTVNFSRTLRPGMNLALNARFTDAEDDANDDTSTFRFNATLGYDVGRTVRATFRVSHLRRGTDADESDLTENVASVRLVKTF